jgi:uncharacterized protein
MTSHIEEINQENPFQKLNLRNLLISLFLISISCSIVVLTVFFIFAIIAGNNLRTFHPDPLISIINVYLVIPFLIFYMLQKCRNHKISVRQIIGKPSINYKWPILIAVTIAYFIFSKGIFRITYFPLSFIFPDYVMNSISQENAGKTAFPLIYSWLENILNFLVHPFFHQFFLQGILMHTLAAKMGINRSLAILSCLTGLGFPFNISGTVLELICALLYIKTRTLVIPIIVRVLVSIYSIIWSNLMYSLIPKTLEEFQGQLGWGSTCVFITVPFLVVFFYKTWPSKNQVLPYFSTATLLKSLT